MSLTLTVCASEIAQEKSWAEALRNILKSLGQIPVSVGHESIELGQLVFVDGSMKEIDRFLEKIDRRSRAVFLVLGEQDEVPELWKAGKVDDVIVFPFRTMDVLSKLRYYEQILVHHQVVALNSSVSDLLVKVQEDLELAERLQRANFPKRFPSVKGFRIESRYFAGIRAGGDYFDLAESEDKSHMSIILTHSTSYGLSSAVLTALMRVMMKLSSDRMGVDGITGQVIRQIYDELARTLGEKDQLSLFYGVFSRRERRLRFLNLGGALIFHALPQQVFQKLSNQGGAVLKGSDLSGTQESSLELVPGARLGLLSFGFEETLGGSDQVRDVLNDFRNREGIDLINELAFKMKKSFKGSDEMPSQDCSAMVLDVEADVLKLAKQEQDEN